MTKQCIITRLTKERRGYLIEKTNFFIEREISTARPFISLIVQRNETKKGDFCEVLLKTTLFKLQSFVIPAKAGIHNNKTTRWLILIFVDIFYVSFFASTKKERKKFTE